MGFFGDMARRDLTGGVKKEDQLRVEAKSPDNPEKEREEQLIKKYEIANKITRVADYSFNLDGYNSIRNIIESLNISIKIECGIKYHKNREDVDHAKKYWESVRERLRRLAEKDQSYYEKLQKVEKILNEIEGWADSPIRGYYDSYNKEIVIYPEEMEEEYDGKKMDELLVSTFIHETMHAFFDRPGHNSFPYLPLLEEPLAEFGMLLLLKAFNKANYYDWAHNDVKNKSSFYKYSADLMDKYSNDGEPSYIRSYFEGFKPCCDVMTLLGIEPFLSEPMVVSRESVNYITTVISNDCLRDFVLSVFKELNSMGVLNRLTPFLRVSSSCASDISIDGGSFHLNRILFPALKTPSDASRWFMSDVFTINGQDYYLSNQWAYGGKSSHLQLSKFGKLVSHLAPDLYINIEIVNGKNRYSLKSL